MSNSWPMGQTQPMMCLDLAYGPPWKQWGAGPHCLSPGPLPAAMSCPAGCTQEAASARGLAGPGSSCSSLTSLHLTTPRRSRGRSTSCHELGQLPISPWFCWNIMKQLHKWKGRKSQAPEKPFVTSFYSATKQQSSSAAPAPSCHPSLSLPPSAAHEVSSPGKLQIRWKPFPQMLQGPVGTPIVEIFVSPLKDIRDNRLATWDSGDNANWVWQSWSSRSMTFFFFSFSQIFLKMN